MTREEAMKRMVRWIDISESKAEIKNDVLAQLNKIYDDFESRICENCVHYDKDIHGVQGWNNCLHLYQVTKPYFGCNNFERKIVDITK